MIEESATRTVGIAEAARRSGLSVHTLRYYERIGLLEGVDRDPGGQRRYAEQDLTWIDFLTRLRATGMSISDMRRYVRLCREGVATVPERRELLVHHRERVRDQMARLGEMVELLDHEIDVVYARSGWAAWDRSSAVPSTTPNRCGCWPARPTSG